MAARPEDRFKKSDSVDRAARESFSDTDNRIADAHPGYGDDLARIKANYLRADNDEDRAGWKAEADKLSAAYGYSRNADGSKVTKNRAIAEPPERADVTQRNLQTIANFDKAYGKGDANGYQGVINALLAEIAGAKFTYSAKNDPRYALAEEYAGDAMKNQMAESAALTGGFGNSYGAAVGQQVYNDYMDEAAGNLEDRAYSRFQDEQNDRYQRLNTLIGLEDTAYDRAETAKATAQARLRTYFEEGGDMADLPEEVKVASGYTDAEIVAIYRSAQDSRSKDTSADARDRVNAFISNGGDPSKLPHELLAASGYTDAEVSAARAYVLENIRRKNASTYSGSQSGSSKTAADDQADAAGDAEGLFYAAYEASERPNSGTTPEEYIAKNYKAFGFDSANGLVKQYRETMSPRGVMDISEEDAFAYLKESGISTDGVIGKEQFYAQDCKAGGKQYDSYADYIDDLADGALRQSSAKTAFMNEFFGNLKNMVKEAKEK